MNNMCTLQANLMPVIRAYMCLSLLTPCFMILFVQTFTLKNNEYCKTQHLQTYTLIKQIHMKSKNKYLSLKAFFQNKFLIKGSFFFLQNNI